MNTNPEFTTEVRQVVRQFKELAELGPFNISLQQVVGDSLVEVKGLPESFSIEITNLY